MLQIVIPPTEMWDEEKEEFVKTKKQVLNLEHSLLSLSKWESKWKKSFLGKTEKTPEEMADYIRCMTIGKVEDPTVYSALTEEQVNEINDYISDPMTATTFRETNQRPNNEVITSELIYYWMIALNIPPEYQKWHLNRLLTLVRVCTIKNQPPKKRSTRQIMTENAALNAARRKALGTKG